MTVTQMSGFRLGPRSALCLLLCVMMPVQGIWAPLLNGTAIGPAGGGPPPGTAEAGSRSPDDWPQFHHDPSRTGATDSPAPASNTTIWTFSAGAAVNSSPAVEGGAVFVGSADSNLYALNSSTGDLLWNASTGGKLCSSPAVADGLVYIGSDDGGLHCYFGNNGTVSFNYSAGAPVRSPVLVGDSMVMFGADTGALFALDAGGTKVWSNMTPFPIRKAPAAAGGIVFVASGPRLSAFNLTYGTPLWNVTPGTGNLSHPCAAAGRVFVGLEDGYMCAFDASGAPAWSGPVPVQGAMVSSAAYSEGSLFFGTRGQRFYKMDAASGSISWNVSADGAVESSAAVSRQTALFGTAAGLTALNSTSGSPLWSFPVPGGVGSSPAISKARAYAGTVSGAVVAFGFRHTARISSAGPSPVAQGVNATFNGSSPDCTPVAYQWRSSLDGNLSASASFNISTLTLGVHQVGFRIQDENWTWSDWDYASIEVVPSAEWPMFMKDTSHRGWSEGTAPLTNTLVWSSNVGGQIYASPVVYRGMVFIGTRVSEGETLGEFYALDIDTGTRIWSYTNTAGQFIATAACADGLVFVADDTRNVIAFEADPRDGVDDGKIKDFGGKERDIIWAYEGRSVVGSLVVANGKVIVPSKGDATIYALDEFTGVPVWNYSLPDPNNSSVLGSPAVDSGLVVFGSNNRRLYALDLETGREVWNFTTGDKIRGSSPSIYNDIVYFGSWDRRLYALNLNNGTQKWNSPTGLQIDSTPAIANGKVLFGSADTKFRALDADTGYDIWTCTTIGAAIGSSAAVGGGLAFFGTGDGRLCAINETTGNIEWTYYAGAGQSVLSSPALVDGRLYVGLEGGTVLAFGKAPDLQVPASEINLSVPRPLVGQQVTVSARVYNFGSLDATAEARISDGLPGEVLSMSVIHVPVGGCVAVSANWTVGPGVHRLVVNVTNTTPYEANQVNNLAFKEYVPPPQQGWTMFKYGPERTSARENLTTPNSNEISWSCETHAAGFSSPVTAGDRVYLAAGNTLFAFDSRGGKPLWSYTAGAPIRSTPAVSNIIVFGCSDGAVTALNEWDGSMIWSISTGGEVFSSPLIASDTAYVGSGDGNLYSISLFDGRTIWKKQLGGPVLSSPAFDPASDRLVVGCQYGDAGRLYCIYSNGTEAWNFTALAPIESSPAVHGGVAYTGCDDGLLYAFEVVPDGLDEGVQDAENSSYDLIWRTNMSIYVRGDNYRVRSSPAVFGGSLYVGVGYNTLAALDLTSGKVLWYRDLGSPVSDRYMFSSPAVSDGRLFVGGPGLFALNTRNGATVWSYTPGGWVWSSPAMSMESGKVFKAAVYAVTEEGRLCAFSATVNIPPVARIASPAPGQRFRSGESILFNGSASWDPDGEIVNYTWSFGDGNASYAEAVYHNYSLPGDYDVSLTVRDDRALENRTYVNLSVRVNSAPELRFPIVEPDRGDVDSLFSLRVAYYDADNDSASFVRARAGAQAILLTQLDPSDANNTDGKEYFCETRLLSGVYGIYFEASDGVLLSSTPIAANVTVTNQSLFSYQNTFFVEMLYAGRGEVRFNLSVAPHDPPPGLVKVSAEVEITESNIDSWRWANVTVDFSDFNLTGVNRSTLRIYRFNTTSKNWAQGENAGIDLEKNRTWVNVTSLSNFAVFAQPPINRPPVARLGKDITIMEGETAIFNASGSFDPDGDQLNYSWDFGDSPGKPAVRGDKTAEHKYIKPGRYTVTLTVSDGRLTGNATETVIVKQKGGEQFVIVIVVIIVLVVGIIFLLPRGDKEGSARWSEEEFQKGLEIRKRPGKKGGGPPGPVGEGNGGAEEEE